MAVLLCFKTIFLFFVIRFIIPKIDFPSLEKNLVANFQIYYNFCPLTPPKTTPELAMPLILMLEYITVGINDNAYVGFYCIGKLVSINMITQTTICSFIFIYLNVNKNHNIYLCGTMYMLQSIIVYFCKVEIFVLIYVKIA